MKVLENQEVCYKNYIYESYGDDEISMFDTLNEMSEWLHVPEMCLEAYREYYLLFIYLKSMDKLNTKFNIKFELNFDNIVDIIRVEKR